MDLHLIGMSTGQSVSGAARAAAGALIAGLWQGLLLCAATGAVLKAVAKGRARLRFSVWTAVFCVSAAVPFVNLAAAPSAGPAGVPAAGHWVFDPRWSYVLTALWLAAVAYRVCGLAVQGFGLWSLWRSAVPVPGGSLGGLEAAPVIAGRRAEICTSGEVDRPSVIGFFAPRILVPDWLFAQLTATELDHIVLHEMEHLRRRDDWVNLLQKIGLALLPLNPALFWIDRRLSTERELACDDGVLARTHSPRAYAASLASVAERRLEARRSSRMGALALAATGLMRRRSELGRRIESILGGRAPGNPKFAGGVAAVLAAGVVGSAAWLAGAPQLVSFGPVAAPGSVAAVSGSLFAPGVNGMSGRSGALAGAAVQPVGFRLPTTRTFHAARVPQRPKPHNEGGVYGTSEAALLGKTAGPAFGQMAAAREGEFSDGGESGPSGDPAVKTRPVSGERWVVLTSWQDSPATSPISQIVIATPDGRFFVAPYAAVPTRAGWLFVQL